MAAKWECEILFQNEDRMGTNREASRWEGSVLNILALMLKMGIVVPSEDKWEGNIRIETTKSESECSKGEEEKVSIEDMG